MNWVYCRLINTRDGRIFFEGSIPYSAAEDWRTRKHVKVEMVRRDERW